MANDHDKLLSARVKARFDLAARIRAAGYLPAAAQQMLRDASTQAAEMPDKAEDILSDALNAHRLLRALTAELTEGATQE